MSKKLERKLRGHRAYERGLEFELKVRNWLDKQGFKSQMRERTKRGEVDIIATKRGWFSGGKGVAGWLMGGYGDIVMFVECKDKSKITVKDFVVFVDKFSGFMQKESEAYGLFAYRGELDKDIKKQLRSVDKKIRERIKLKKWRKRR